MRISAQRAAWFALGLCACSLADWSNPTGQRLAFAAAIKFPYEATVASPDAPVYSGPGQRYYETSRLNAGDRVIVHRHDPGGWFMIAPPTAAFSLVEANNVRRQGSGLEVTAEECSVRVGSRTDTRNDVEQIRLVTGDRLEVLPQIAAPQGWIAVRPPRGEYRWISGQHLQQAVKPGKTDDPFAIPAPRKATPATPAAAPKQKSPAMPANLPAEPIASPGSPAAPTAAAATALQNDAMSARLEALDQRLTSLDSIEPTEWPIDELERQYRELHAAASPGTARLIDARLAQLKRYRLIYNEYKGYIQLVSATDQRDAELLAQQAAGEVSPPLMAGVTSGSISSGAVSSGPVSSGAGSSGLGPTLAEPLPTPAPPANLSAMAENPPVAIAAAPGPHRVHRDSVPPLLQNRPVISSEPLVQGQPFPLINGGDRLASAGTTGPMLLPPSMLHMEPGAAPMRQPPAAPESGVSPAPRPMPLTGPMTATTGPMPITGPIPGRQVPSVEIGQAAPTAPQSSLRQNLAGPVHGTTAPVPTGSLGYPQTPSQAHRVPIAAGPRPTGPMPMQTAAPMPAQTMPAQTTTAQPAVQGTPARQRFDAVGVIQPSNQPAQAGQFVLVAPNGQIVAYLQEDPRLPLRQFVGQAMGIDGRKRTLPNTATPTVVVERLTPIRF